VTGTRRKVAPNRRLYASGDYTYHCAVEGSFEWYSGGEEIFLAGKPIYECLFHGGLVK